MVSTEIIKNWGGGQNGGAENNLGGGHLPPLAPPGAATAKVRVARLYSIVALDVLFEIII